MVHHTRRVRILQPPQEAPCRGVKPRQEKISVKFLTSELVAQRKLNLANRAYDGKIALGGAKCKVCDATIQSVKDMAVEGIGNINLEDNRLPFIYGSTFKDGKVLIEVMLTSNVAEDQRSVAEDVPALGHKSRSVGIDERRTVEEVVGAVGDKGAVGLFRAAAIGGRGVKRAMVGSQEGL